MDRLLNKYREKQQEILQSLVESPCASLDEYKKRIGQHQGLQLAIDEILHLMRDADE
jgi:transposase